jgi:hypothetical protein
MDFDGVRALVVLPELPVAGGAVGAPASVLLEELDDCRAVDSFVRALVVLPEFAPAVGSFVEFAVAELEELPESLDVLFAFLLLAVPVLVSPATGVSPVGGVALAEGSAAALFFVLLVAVGVVFAFSPSVFPAPEELAESVESGAVFFFFFAAVESLCDWSVDCVDCCEVLPCDAPIKPNPNKKTIETAKLKFFFIAVLWLPLEESLSHSEPAGLASFRVPLRIAMAFNPRYRDSQVDDAAGCAP